MATTLNVKRNIQFRPDLYRQTDRTAWLDAVGKEIEFRGISIKVGEGASAVEVKNAEELKSAMNTIWQAGSAPGTPAQFYAAELLEAIDDVVKRDAKTKTGDRVNLSTGSRLSQALGIDDAVSQNYADARSTEFGRAAEIKTEASMSVEGVTLQVGPLHMSTESLSDARAAYGRDGEEVEDTRVITGLTKEEIVELASGNGLRDLQRPKAVAGLALGDGVPLDEISWDSDAHALRRANPYVSFTLEKDRSLESDPSDGQPRVAVSRDYFLDTFMAKKNLHTGKLGKELQDAGLMYRARIRYGGNLQDPHDGTRVLIQMKEGTSIDADGTKHARKIDSRTDSTNENVFKTLKESAIRGKMHRSWGEGDDSVAPAAAAMHRTAVLRGITDDFDGETHVLKLEPAAVARQIRARFHLDETSPEALLDAFNTLSEPSLNELVQLIKSADWTASGNLKSKTELLAQAVALLDRSAIVAAATEGLKQIDASLNVDRALIDSLWPNKPVANKADIRKQRVVADAIRQQYDAFADEVDKLQNQIGGSTDQAVTDAGSANDVRDFLRQKAAVARFMAHAESDRSSGVQPGQPATYLPYLAKIKSQVAQDNRESTQLLARIGVGSRHLNNMNEASFSSPLKVNRELVKKQTFKGYLTEFETQLAGPNRQALIDELGAFLAAKRSPGLSNATDKSKVLAQLRHNLASAHVEVLHRQLEAAGSWGQAMWFNNYRRAALGINPQGWNFIIGSMDYTEFYDAKMGAQISDTQAMSRRPLPVANMTGAMLSNDMQIELSSEERYTGAIRKAQYAINGAVAGLLMDFALSQNTPNLVPDPAGFEAWAQTQTAASLGNDFATFAKDKGSLINVAQAIPELAEQAKAIRALVGFAKEKNPTLDTSNRASVEAWYRTQGALSASELDKLLNEIAQYCAREKIEIPLSPNLLRTLDFQAFTPARRGQPTTTHASLVDDLKAANEVWSMMKKAQQDLSAARGKEIQKVLRDNNLTGKGWEPPTKPKGDYAIDLVLP